MSILPILFAMDWDLILLMQPYFSNLLLFSFHPKHQIIFTYRFFLSNYSQMQPLFFFIQKRMSTEDETMPDLVEDTPMPDAGVGLDDEDIWGGDDSMAADIANKSTAEIRQQRISIENEIRVIKSNINQLDYTNKKKQETVDDNKSKIKLNKTLPYLVSNVVEILDPLKDEDGNDIIQEAGGAKQDEAMGKSVVVKTTTRQTIYLPLPGLVDPDDLKPGELIGTNKDR